MRLSFSSLLLLLLPLLPGIPAGEAQIGDSGKVPPLAPEAAWDGDCAAHGGAVSADGKTCTLTGSFEAASDFRFAWRGDLALDNFRANVQTGDVRLLAGGTLTVKGQSSITAQSSVVLCSRGRLDITDGYVLSWVAIELGGLSCGSQGDISVSASKVVAPSMDVSSKEGAVHLGHRGNLMARTLRISARTAQLSGINSSIGSAQVLVQAEGLLSIGAIFGRNDAAVELRAGTELHLGTSMTIWKVQRLVAVAKSITVLGSQSIQAAGTSACSNNVTQERRQCARFLDAPLGDGVHKSTTDQDIFFDFVLVAQKILVVMEDSVLLGASFLLCGGEKISLGAGTIVNAAGRGCGPGEGPGAGTTGTDAEVELRGSYESWSLRPCAPGGRAVANFSLALGRPPPALPTAGASGGGCGMVEEQDCWKLRRHPAKMSFGGGLAWLEAGELELLGNFQLLVDGSDGDIVLEDGSTRVSGGGAGGQVLLFAACVRAGEASARALLSASGGGGACDDATHAVSGSGGGGLVGFGWTGQPQEDCPDPLHLFEVRAEGGRPSQHFSLAADPEGAVQGQPGLITGLVPCPAGYAGTFCDPCPVGFWSDNGLSCQQCTNSHGYGVYTQSGWPNALCPYKCPAGTPNIRINPDCLSPLQCALQFFTNLIWCFPAALLLALLAGHSLCRRCGGRLPLYTARQPGGLHFNSQHLPCHVRRVFLVGRNGPGSAWALGGERPAAAEGLLDRGQWAELARELGARAAVPRAEALACATLAAFLPPARALLALWCRWKRARSLHMCVKSFTENLAGRQSLWRQVSEAGTSSLRLTFGCDDGATLGYLDFFDLSVSSLDWAPVDLRQEARLLVSRGNGSYFEPWSLDVGDPLLQELAQAGFGGAQVRRLAAAFDRAARLLPKGDGLGSEAAALALGRLQASVESCAAENGLPGRAQVLLLGQSLPLEASNETVPPISSDPRRSGSFTTLVQQLKEMKQMPAHAPGDSRASPTFGTANVKMDYRVSLAFLDRNASIAALPASHKQGSEASDRLKPGLLSSPLPYGRLANHIANVVEDGRGPPAPARDLWSVRVLGLLASGGRGLGLHLSVLSLLVLFTTADAAWSLFVGHQLWQLDPASFALWLLAPPLVPALSSLAGALAVLAEKPRWGRIAAAIAALSAVNLPVAVLLRSAWLEGSSWYFEFREVVLTSFIKLGLACSLHGHCSNLEVTPHAELGDAQVPEFRFGGSTTAGSMEGGWIARLMSNRLRLSSKHTQGSSSRLGSSFNGLGAVELSTQRTSQGEQGEPEQGLAESVPASFHIPSEVPAGAARMARPAPPAWPAEAQRAEEPPHAACPF